MCTYYCFDVYLYMQYITLKCKKCQSQHCFSWCWETDTQSHKTFFLSHPFRLTTALNEQTFSKTCKLTISYFICWQNFKIIQSAIKVIAIKLNLFSILLKCTKIIPPCPPCLYFLQMEITPTAITKKISSFNQIGL